jgi:hypothetical protein
VALKLSAEFIVGPPLGPQLTFAAAQSQTKGQAKGSTTKRRLSKVAAGGTYRTRTPEETRHGQRSNAQQSRKEKTKVQHEGQEGPTGFKPTLRSKTRAPAQEIAPSTCSAAEHDS